MTITMKKNPRGPSMSLPEAIDKVSIIYENEGKHTVATEVIAQDLGYKDATSGAAITTLATMKFYNLLIPEGRGKLSVSEDFEDYKFTTDIKKKREILIKWLMSPQIFHSLLETYPSSLPSEAALKYQLIKLGFNEKKAASFLNTFTKSVEFCDFYNKTDSIAGTHSPSTAIPSTHDRLDDFDDLEDIEDPSSQDTIGKLKTKAVTENTDSDRIPIRLSGGRKAWLEIPVPFYEEDKAVIKNYTDIIVTNEKD